MKDLVILTATILFASPAIWPVASYAAPVMNSAECKIRGVVEKVQERKERYEPRSWADSYDLPEFVIYTDVTVVLEPSSEVLVADQMTCQAIGGKTSATYQWRPSSPQPKVGQTIQGTTQFSGDEFYMGNFITPTSAALSLNH